MARFTLDPPWRSSAGFINVVPGTRRTRISIPLILVQIISAVLVQSGRSPDGAKPENGRAREGHAVRFVPIAPELRPILLARFDEAELGTEAVIPRLSNPGLNLRTHCQRIIQRAGEQP